MIEKNDCCFSVIFDKKKLGKTPTKTKQAKKNKKKKTNTKQTKPNQKKKKKAKNSNKQTPTINFSCLLIISKIFCI